MQTQHSDSLRFLLFGLVVLALVLARTETLPAQAADSLRYSENNEYVPNAFPKEVISRDFSIPIDADSLMVVYPSAVADEQVARWRRSLNERLGANIPFRAANSLSGSALGDRHLIIMGNINNNPRAMELYKQRYAFADAYFPGAGGFTIHPGTSVWNNDRNVLVIGTSRTRDLGTAFEAFVGQLPASARSIGAIRMLQTDLDFPTPPPGMEPFFNNFEDTETRPPYGSIGKWGLAYHLTGDEKWAEYFRDAFYKVRKRARKTGEWLSEPWSNMYFSLSEMIMAWDLIDDSPFFSDQDRRVIEEVLWGYTTFARGRDYLDPENVPLGEMRQNHTTFLALSLYFAHRYYTRKYNLKGLDSMMDKVHRAFDKGQANSFMPNDDGGGGGYITYAPTHTLTYLLASGKKENNYITQGRLARTANLFAATIDNRGDMVSFGDVGGYHHVDSISNRNSRLLKTFALSARFYDRPQYQWLYNWSSAVHKGGKSFSLGGLFGGEYATPMAAGDSSMFTGLQTIRLDTAARQWISRRAWSNDRLPRQKDGYFHKIAFRRSFAPDDEYLLLDGLSAFSHGHHDGNSILRLTWKDRIWLFDLDYIKYPTKYHNGVTVTRDGVQQDPPKLTRLDFTARGSEFGATRSTAEGYSGADWERTILWRKGRWFFVIDRIKARKTGNYRIVGRWRTRGEVTFEGNRLQALQGGKSFYIKSADAAPRRLEFKPDGYDSDWSEYPWSQGGADVLSTHQDTVLATGDHVTFANLLAASDDTADPGYGLGEVADNLYRVTDAEDTSLLVGLDPGRLERLGVSTDAGLFLMESDRLHLIDASRVRFNGKPLQDSSLSRHLIFDLQSGALQDFQGNTLQQLDAPRAESLRSSVKATLVASSRLAHEVQPAGGPSEREDFGLRPAGRIPLQAPVTARSESAREDPVLGDAKGRLLVFDDNILDKDKIIRTPAGAEITAVATGDLDGDGGAEIVAGDREGTIYCYNAGGELRWQQKLTAYRGDASARDITIEVDDGGDPVVLVATGGWKAYALGPQGDVRWDTFVFYHPLTRIDAIDVSPKKRYVVAGTVYHTPFNVIDPETGGGIYHAWEQMGSESEASTGYFGIHLTDMTFFDADRDSLRDIIFGTLSNNVYAVNAADGAKIWEANAGGEVTKLTQFTAPDSGALRLLVANGAGEVSVFDRNGNRLHHARLAHRRITDFRVLPAEQGRVDIAATTQGGDLVIFDESLLVRAKYHFDEPLQGVFLTGRRGRSHQLLGIGANAVYRVGYEAFHLRKSWHY